jgi:iron complex transport system substrate-binding protein
MFRRLIPLAIVAAMVTAACGSSDAGDSEPPSTQPTTSVSRTTTTEQEETTTTTKAADDGFPVVVDAPNGLVRIESRPERVVSISPTSTEVLFAIGAGEQVVAVDSMSNFPTHAPVTDLSAFTPSVEAIASYEPDLVFLSFDPGDIVAGLEAIGIPVILHGTAFAVDDAFAQWEQTGAATGHIAAAVGLVADTVASMESAFGSLSDVDVAMSYYYELDPTLYSVTSATFIGDLLEPSGMMNIADAGDPDGSGYPQLSAEYVVASDPTLILLADTKCCGASAETVAERPGWDTLTAVMSDGVVELDDDVASRWGPRIAELVMDVVEAMLELEPSNA